MGSEILKQSDSENLARRTRRFFRRTLDGAYILTIALSVYSFAMLWIELSSGSTEGLVYFGVGFLVSALSAWGLQKLEL